MVNSYILYNKSTTNGIKWFWNSGYTDSMLLYNILVHKKSVFNFFKLVGMVTLSDSLTCIFQSPLKLIFSFLIIEQGPQIYQKMRNFKQNKNAIYDFFREINSFRVIVKKPFKMKVFFRGGWIFFFWIRSRWT